MAEQAAWASAYLLRFSLPEVLWRRCDVAQMTAILTVHLRCSWEPLSLGNPPFLEQAVSKPAACPQGDMTSSLKVTKYSKQSCPRKRANSHEETFSKGGNSGKPTVSGDWKSSEQTPPAIWVNGGWHCVAVGQFAKLLSTTAWKIGNATNKLWIWLKKSPGRMLKAYDKL